MAREDVTLRHLDAPAPRADQELSDDLRRLPPEEVLATIRRQRLETLLHGDPYIAELLPHLWPTLQGLARRETMAALALASLTREIHALFQKAQTPMLVIKGVPLALQSTGAIAARGHGDLDLFVAPEAVVRSVEALREHGFRLSKPKDNAFLEQGILGRYCRSTCYGLELERYHSHSCQSIDLHWRLDFPARSLPEFRQSYARRARVDVGGSIIDTLCLTDAFLHVCAHAAKDRWMCLRNLVDVCRLACLLEPEDFSALQAYPFVGLSCAVAHEAIGSPLPVDADLRGPWLERRLGEASERQQLAWRQPSSSYRTPMPGLLLNFRALFEPDCASGSQRWIGRLAAFMLLVLPPDSVRCPATGRFRLPLHYYLVRFSSYCRRLMGSCRWGWRVSSRSASR